VLSGDVAAQFIAPESTQIVAADWRNELRRYIFERFSQGESNHHKEQPS